MCVAAQEKWVSSWLNNACHLPTEKIMAKGDQRSNKMDKKPKKDTSPPKLPSGENARPMPPMTTIIPRGKDKDKFK